MRKIIFAIIFILFAVVVFAQPTLTEVESLLIKLHLSHVQIAELTSELRDARDTIAEKQLTIERILITPQREDQTFNWNRGDDGQVIG